MEIGQGSFYATFGSKQELFRRALDDFADKVIAEMLAVLRCSDDPRAAVLALLAGAADIDGGDPAHRGAFWSTP